MDNSIVVVQAAQQRKDFRIIVKDRGEKRNIERTAIRTFQSYVKCLPCVLDSHQEKTSNL